jgi:hypothetical protein
MGRFIRGGYVEPLIVGRRMASLASRETMRRVVGGSDCFRRRVHDAAFEVAGIAVRAKVNVWTQWARPAAKAGAHDWIHAAEVAAAPDVDTLVHELPCSSIPNRLELYASRSSGRQQGTGRLGKKRLSALGRSVVFNIP